MSIIYPQQPQNVVFWKHNVLLESVIFDSLLLFLRVTMTVNAISWGPNGSQTSRTSFKWW